MTTTHSQIGQTMRGLRKAAGLTLDTVARLADTAPAYLSKVECGALIASPAYLARVTTAIAAEMTRQAASVDKRAAA